MVDVVAALVRQGNRFLICQRPSGKKLALLWEFPGGKVEPGETPEQALVRECQEELGVTLSVGPLYMEVQHRYPEGRVRLQLFEAEVQSGALTLKEHADMRWITPEQIPQYAFCPADVDILKRLQSEV